MKSLPLLVFITKEYIRKVNGDNAGDHCKLEFKYAANCKTNKFMIPVVLDASCRDTSQWIGTFGFLLRGELYVDFVNDNDFEKNLKNLYKEINKRINISSPITTAPDNQSVNVNEIRSMEDFCIII